MDNSLFSVDNLYIYIFNMLGNWEKLYKSYTYRGKKLGKAGKLGKAFVINDLSNTKHGSLASFPKKT